MVRRKCEIQKTAKKAYPISIVDERGAVHFEFFQLSCADSRPRKNIVTYSLPYNKISALKIECTSRANIAHKTLLFQQLEFEAMLSHELTFRTTAVSIRGYNFHIISFQVRIHRILV